MERLAEEVVAQEDGHLVAIHAVDRRLSAALAALIDDVVVDEAGGVEQFDGDGRAVGLLGEFAKLASHEGHEEGAHHLTAALAYIGQRHPEEIVLVAERLVEIALVAVHLMGYGLAYGGEYIHA